MLMKRVGTIFPCIAFHCRPEVLDIIQLAVKFWVNDHFMASSCNYSLKQGDLVSEICLVPQDSKGTAASPFGLRWLNVIRVG